MKTVVLGTGYWGKNYVRELAGNLVAVVDPDKDAAEHMRQIYNVPAYPKLPDDLDFDAAIIATPPSKHVELAVPILESGKYVLVEKPLATSVEEAMKLYPHRKRCMAAHLYLYHPGVFEMKECVKCFPISHAFSRRTNHGPIRSWQNALWDLAPHDISIFNYLFGKPSRVEATGMRDWAVVNIAYSGGVNAVTYVSWLGGPKTRTIDLVSTEEHNKRFIFDDLQWVLGVSPLRRMLNAFLSGEWEHCTVDEGIEVLQVLEACRI